MLSGCSTTLIHVAIKRVAQEGEREESEVKAEDSKKRY
jgi:hypothetical protein